MAYNRAKAPRSGNTSNTLRQRNAINPRDPSRAFRAQYAGTCAKCGNHFPEGARVRKDNGEYFHAGCRKDLIW